MIVASGIDVWRWKQGDIDLAYISTLYEIWMPDVVDLARSARAAHPIVVLVCGLAVLYSARALPAACWVIFAATFVRSGLIYVALSFYSWPQALLWAGKCVPFVASTAPTLVAALYARSLLTTNESEWTCGTCHYNLRGLVEFRCPECGHVHRQ